MRKSFGGGGGMGGGGGGAMLRSMRTFRRPLKTTAASGEQDPFSQSNTTTTNNNSSNNTYSNNPRNPNYTNSNSTSIISPSLSSSGTTTNLPFSAVPPWLSSCDDEFEWDYCIINETQEDKDIKVYDDSLFWTVPSKDEAHHALSALQQAYRPAYFSDTDEEFHSSNNSMKLEPQSGGSDPSVREAFRLLQTEPAVQKMVVSLSSDKAVWDAVLNNEVVRELRASLYQGGADENTVTTGNKDNEGSNATGRKDNEGFKAAENNVTTGSKDNEGSNVAMEILGRIFFNTKTKVAELIEKITELVYNLFSRPQTTEEGTTRDPFEIKLKTSFLLSVVVFVVVAVSRARKA